MSQIQAQISEQVRVADQASATLQQKPQEQEITKSKIVFYHGGCTDGFCSAWIANQVLGHTADYIPISYSQELDIERLRGKEVYVLDFSFKKDVVQKLLEVANKTIILDHHKTALEELKDLVGTNEKKHIVFDMSKSGSILSWDYFSNGNIVAPLLVQYVNDRDLWKFELKNSREINEVIGCHAYDFKEYDALFTLLTQENLPNLIQAGTFLLKQKERMMERILKHQQPMTWESHKGVMVNSPVLQSEIGEALYKNPDVALAVVWYWNEKGDLVFSLRSNKVDVSALAKKRGGGGHPGAAGFTVKAIGMNPLGGSNG